MSFALGAISKNTFITFVAEGLEDIDGDLSMMASPRLQPRSRSAEPVSSRPMEADELEELTQQSLQRLTTVMQSGVLEPSPRSPKARSQASPRHSQTSSPCLNSTPTKPWDKKLRVESSCSLSTMAPDDASESGEPSGNRMRPVWSSGSICSMVSDFVLNEDEECQFELDIEAGEEAAARQEKAIVPAPALPTVPALPTDASPTIHGKVTSEMCHSLVPKNHNMAEMYKTAKDAPPTTLMIRNIPGKYSQNDLMLDLKDTGFGCTYDFLYLPIDKGTAANVGYAFVNFTDAAVAAKCIKSFEGHRFTRHQRSSNKLARISVAHLQGLEKNLQHYENAAVNASKEKRRRPVIVANISKMFD